MTGSPCRGLARVTPPRALHLLLFGVVVVLGVTVTVPTPARAAASGPSDDASPAPALGLQVTDDVDGSMPPDRAQVTYTVELANAGATDLTEITLTDRLPEALAVAGVDVPDPWTCVLPSGSSMRRDRDGDAAADDEPGRAPPAAREQLHCTLGELAAGTTAPPLAVTVQVPDDVRGDVTYRVEAAAGEAGPVEATATTTVPAPDGELSVDLADDVTDTVPHGGEFTFTITVANPGPVELTAVSVDATVPADVVVAGVTAPGPWTCVLPDQGGNGGQLYCTLDVLAAGTSAPPLHVAVQVPEGVSGQLRSVVVADSAETDPVEASTTTSVDVATEVLGRVIEQPTAGAAPSADADAGATVDAELARTGPRASDRALAFVAVGVLALGALLLRVARPVTAGR